MIYTYHVAVTRDEPIPPVDALPTVEADSPLAAIDKLAKSGGLPSEVGQSFWIRIVVAVENGKPTKAVSMPLTVEAKMPLDWRPRVQPPC